MTIVDVTQKDQLLELSSRSANVFVKVGSNVSTTIVIRGERISPDIRLELAQDSEVTMCVDVSECYQEQLNIHVVHVGDDSRSNIWVVSQPTVTQSLQRLEMVTELNADRCQSDILCKTVQNDFSNSLEVVGEVISRQGARSIQASFYHYNWALTEKLKLATRPQLRIHNKQIECRHGFSTRVIRGDQQDFLAAKGFSQDQIQNLMREAFVKEVYQQFPIQFRS
jgi:Fe-S cluster assembly scaffold protein SufB